MIDPAAATFESVAVEPRVLSGTAEAIPPTHRFELGTHAWHTRRA